MGWPKKPSRFFCPWNNKAQSCKHLDLQHNYLNAISAILYSLTLGQKYGPKEAFQAR
jgi:hypothetical protein